MTPTNQTAPAIPGCISRLVVGSSDTPETDERAFHCWRWDTHKMDYTPYGEVVTSTYARRIERERDEERTLADHLADAVIDLRTRLAAMGQGGCAGFDALKLWQDARSIHSDNV